MDVITQGLLGGVLAQSAANRNEKKWATLAGVASGLVADADVLIYSSSDPLLNIEYHRHFTHALVFIPFGAAIASLLLWPFLHRHLQLARLYLFCLLGYSMSGMIDACTSYGTHLFWPFSDERIAWHIISIVDPIFTIIILITFILGLKVKLKNVSYIGLSLALAYMLFGYLQLQRAEDAAAQLALSRGHIPLKHVVKPTLGNLLLWRSTYIREQQIYVDAVRLNFFSGNQIYQGETVEQFILSKEFPELDSNTALYEDIQRFNKFSDDFIAYDPTQENVLGDIRYSMLPTSVKPLWGIIVEPQKPDQHSDYRFFRDNDATMRQKFIDMLFGRSLPSLKDNEKL
ncbi:MAG: metal-dependent hydrolase [Thioalkalispiraceae bacterium]|jgi:inner membrane protein